MSRLFTNINMKKILFSLVMAFMAISANAQVTWNVRAGGGVFQTEDYISHYSSWRDSNTYHFYIYDTYEWDAVPCAALALQVNIPFKRTSRFTFSPTFMAACSNESRIEFPLYFGYKVPIGNRNLFFPKIGPMVGCDVCTGYAMCGPSLELAFEIKHFIVAANVSVDCVMSDAGSADVGGYLTFGYKF